MKAHRTSRLCYAATTRCVCHGRAASPTVQRPGRHTVERNSTVAHGPLCFGLAVVLTLASNAIAWDLEPLPSPDNVAGNLVADASFEQGGWQATGGATLVKSARTGSHAGRIERDSEKADPRLSCVVKGAQQGKWLLSAWMKSDLPSIDDPNYAAIVEVEWLDRQGKALSKHRGVHLNGYTPIWEYRAARVDAPVGTSAARLALRFSFSVCGICDVDDVALTPAGEEDRGAETGRVSLLLRPVSRIFAAEGMGVAGGFRGQPDKLAWMGTCQS